MPPLRVVSIAWFAQQRRGEKLARRLGGDFLPLPCPRQSLLRRPAQYRRLARQTIRILSERQPDLVLVQNPPIYAVAAVASYCRKAKRENRDATAFAAKTGGVPIFLRPCRYVVDSHSGPFLDTGLSGRLHRWRFARLGRQALVTLIHNNGLVPYAEELGLRHLVLEDPVPDLPTEEKAALRHPAVAMVCGYGFDEPLDDMLRAAGLLTDVSFYFTGKTPIRGHDAASCPRMRLPANAEATGFLPELDYWRLVNAADVVVALTSREATILGGAYDALAAGRPMVISRTETLADLFYKGAVLVENQAETIAEGIRRALQTGPELSRRLSALREQKAREWERQFRALTDILKEPQE